MQQNQIIGLGNDIVNIARIEAAIARFGDKFLRKIFTSEEIAAANNITHAKRKSGYYAKRFAAKEALVKALGTGFTKGVGFRDIAVLNDEYGKPVVFVYNKLKTLLNQANIHISLSDDYPFAMATVLLS